MDQIDKVPAVFCRTLRNAVVEQARQELVRIMEWLVDDYHTDEFEIYGCAWVQRAVSYRLSRVLPLQARIGAVWQDLHFQSEGVAADAYRINIDSLF